MRPVMRFLIPWSLAALGAATTTPAVAQYAVGLAAFNRGDYDIAQREFEPLARQGDADAQYWLGRIYGEGLGGERDLVTAHAWLDRAASLGHRNAQIVRSQIEASMTPQQIAQAQQQSRQLAGGDSASGNNGAASTDRSVVAEIQRELRRLGYQPGGADGIYGDRTRTAIERFQRDTGREPDGRPTDRLLEALRQAETGAMRTGAAPPPPPMPKPREGELLPPAAINTVRKELTKHGYQPGAAEGAIDSAMREAIRDYQRDARLPVTGEASQALLDHLLFAEPPVYRR